MSESLFSSSFLFNAKAFWPSKTKEAPHKQTSQRLIDWRSHTYDDDHHDDEDLIPLGILLLKSDLYTESQNLDTKYEYKKPIDDSV